MSTFPVNPLEGAVYVAHVQRAFKYLALKDQQTLWFLPVANCGSLSIQCYAAQFKQIKNYKFYWWCYFIKLFVFSTSGFWALFRTQRGKSEVQSTPVFISTQSTLSCDLFFTLLSYKTLLTAHLPCVDLKAPCCIHFVRYFPIIQQMLLLCPMQVQHSLLFYYGVGLPGGGWLYMKVTVLSLLSSSLRLWCIMLA